MHTNVVIEFFDKCVYNCTPNQSHFCLAFVIAAPRMWPLNQPFKNGGGDSITIRPFNIKSCCSMHKTLWWNIIQLLKLSLQSTIQSVQNKKKKKTRNTPRKPEKIITRKIVFDINKALGRKTAANEIEIDRWEKQNCAIIMCRLE